MEKSREKIGSRHVIGGRGSTSENSSVFQWKAGGSRRETSLKKRIKGVEELYSIESIFTGVKGGTDTSASPFHLPEKNRNLEASGGWRCV